ncbi:Flp pilus assembly protein, ATPase [Actinobacillus suis]|uniref:Flp pilus assembly protein, ATPase n=2 Tax=Actinobacillus suis TaxID=716 RepID=K0G4C4_ACTSU|nr:Flp pilus assembly protein, ATPase [Actinobacillus suis]AFU19003.1 Flp pilus assembly protein, ATPase [Actinobacillus suis H91-0380]MCO4166802.1 pilus assembly protein [Actinobacillus suis]MCO4168512.1 pilus assembly protein [Actinobacillus suis]MCQ9628783.1 pilus assembly protein [Actinobacillus suis]MCQ9631282.1 pilus assembly protein [Actinobacillus suis]
MLLLDQEGHGGEGVDSIRKIAIISEKNGINNHIAQLLRSRGLENIELIHANFFNAENLAFSAEETVGVIVDIQDETKLANITGRIHSVIPQNVWCCVVGESDSISLLQKLLEQGVLYFNSETQLTQMVARILGGMNIPLVRHTIKISVLGCKGGIGASFISSHIAQTIATEKKVPVLLAQGSNGSQDLDLLFDKKLQSDVAEYTANLDLYRGVPSRLASETLNKYNFIVYDQPIFNVNKEDYPSILQHSNTFVLVVERKISSLRVAKQFLDECERMKANTGRLIRTFVCISDHKQETAKLMATADIERLLKCEVDGVIPYNKQSTNKDTVLTSTLSRQGKKEIATLAMKVIGILSRQAAQRNKKVGLSLFQKLFK